MNPPQPGPLPTRALPEWLSLAGGVAIVTGGGTHLGLAMATALAELGATVYLPGRRTDIVQASAAALQAQGLDAHAVGADAADEVAVVKMVSVRRWPRIFRWRIFRRRCTRTSRPRWSVRKVRRAP